MLRSDDQTFEALLERFTPMLIAYLSGRTRNAGEAEDIIQDVFLAALGQRGRLRDPDRLGVWLLAITRNKLNTLYRRRSLEYRFREDRVDSRSADGDFFVKVADPAQRPDQKAQANEIAEAIAETISRLNDKYRLVLSLSLQHNHSLTETAALLGLKRSTVRMRFHRGLELVRKSLRKKALRLIGRAEMKPKRKVSESEIVESLLADAPGELKERVRQAANEDQTAALLHDHWSQIIEALQSEQPSYESLQERVITNVMARLPHETPASLKTTANESAAGRFTLIARPLRPSWRLLAAAACVVVSTGYFAVSFFGLGFQIQAPSTAVDIRVAGNNGVSSDTQYVAFGWTGAETGTSSQPFSSLHRGIASVSSGGMLKIEAGSTGETAKIAKPLTIVAVGGSVRIGAK